METIVLYSWSALILWAGLYQCLLLVPVLWFQPVGNRLSRRLLGAFLLMMSIRLGLAIVKFSPGGEDMALDIDLGGIGVFLYGPLLYVYLRAYMERKFQLQWQHALHLVPLGLGLLFYLSKSWLFPEMRPFQPGQYSLTTPPPLPYRIVGLGLALTFLSYLFVSIRRIVQFQRFLSNQASFAETSYIRWLLLMAGIMLLPVFSVMLTLFLGGAPHLIPYPAYGVSAMISLIVFIALFKPEMLHGLPEVLMADQPEEIEPTRYESSALTDPQKDRYQADLLAHMEKVRPFLSQDLTLRELAEQLGVNAKYLSQVINERLEQNFMDFINGYRVERAKELLQHDAYQYFTILAIAQEAGFRSKSAFYDAFKKGTGMTPSAFKKAQANT